MRRSALQPRRPPRQHLRATPQALVDLRIRSERPVPAITTLAAVGDIMLGRRVGNRHHADPGAPLKPLARRLAAAEITVGNFESTLSTAGSPTQGGDSFAASPRVIPGLRAAGFDLLSLANNHVGDYGGRAPRQTVDRFHSANIDTVGAGRDLAAARRPAVIQRDGVRVGFIAVDSIGETPSATRNRAGTNRLNMPPRTGPLNRTQLRRITSDIRALNKRVDVVVVLTIGVLSTRIVQSQASESLHAPSPAPALIWSSADIRTEYRAWRWPGRQSSCTRSATSFSTWTFRPKLGKGSFWRLCSGATG